MENFEDELYTNYWDSSMHATMIFQNEDLDWPLDEAGSGESSSPDGAATSPASKNVVSERNRRQRLNQRLFALRSVVPNISKLDKASIIKDSIEYIKELQKQEKNVEAEIRELESRSSSSKNLHESSYGDDYIDFDHRQPEEEEEELDLHTNKKIRSTGDYSPIEVLDMKVTWMGEKTGVVRITCSKKRDTMVKLCQVFESLNLKLITASVTSFFARLSMTVFLEAEDDEVALLEARIQTAISIGTQGRATRNRPGFVWSGFIPKFGPMTNGF